MILEYGGVEDHLASTRAFSSRFLGLVNNSGYRCSALLLEISAACASSKPLSSP